MGYESKDRQEKEVTNRRNRYSKKTMKSTYGEIPINVPRDREGSFVAQIIPKRTTNISGIEDKLLSMYAKGMSQQDIALTIEDIYGFEISHETISEITDCVIEQMQEWQNRQLKECYPFVFVNCMYVTLHKDYETKKYAVYTMLGYDIDGQKDILGLWLNETESKHSWMQIFDEIKGGESKISSFYRWTALAV